LSIVVGRKNGEVGVQLPPERKNEPEWLQIQRRRRRESSNWTYSGLAAMSLAAMLFAIVEALQNETNSGLFDLIAFFVAAILMVFAILVTRRSAKGSFQRGFAGWSVFTYGLFAVGSLATVLRQL
jgi:hypothetical protein